MSTEDHRWVLETGDFADFRIVCTDDGVEFNVHQLMLSLHSTYFARLFKSQFQEIKLGVSNLADVDSQTMRHLLDFFYRGNTPWKCPDDMIMLAKLWILADRLQATSAMIEVEHLVKNKLNGPRNKSIVADWTLLDTVFCHKACAESGLGYVIGEAACVILGNRSQNPKKSDLVEKHARENILSANMMLFWSSRYREENNKAEQTATSWASPSLTQQRIDREEAHRDRLIIEKMTKPSRIMAYETEATKDKKRKQMS